MCIQFHLHPSVEESDSRLILVFFLVSCMPHFSLPLLIHVPFLSSFSSHSRPILILFLFLFTSHSYPLSLLIHVSFLSSFSSHSRLILILFLFSFTSVSPPPPAGVAAVGDLVLTRSGVLPPLRSLPSPSPTPHPQLSHLPTRPAFSPRYASHPSLCHLSIISRILSIRKQWHVEKP